MSPAFSFLDHQHADAPESDRCDAVAIARITGVKSEHRDALSVRWRYRRRLYLPTQFGRERLDHVHAAMFSVMIETSLSPASITSLLAAEPSC